MRWFKFLGGCAVLSFVWLWVLPRIAQYPSVREHLELLDRRNINAGAMYYTEVEEHR